MLDELNQKLTEFIEERDWDQFHTPKDLALNLSVEAAEVLELFLWKSDDSHLEDPKKKEALCDELGDVMMTLLLLSKKLGVDLIECTLNKIERTKLKYPVHLAKGKSIKYTDLGS